jgi:hypothetical protein
MNCPKLKMVKKEKGVSWIFLFFGNYLAATASISISKSGLARAYTAKVERETLVGFSSLLKYSP